MPRGKELAFVPLVLTLGYEVGETKKETLVGSSEGERRGSERTRPLGRGKERKGALSFV